MHQVYLFLCIPLTNPPSLGKTTLRTTKSRGNRTNHLIRAAKNTPPAAANSSLFLCPSPTSSKMGKVHGSLARAGTSYPLFLLD